MSARSVDYPVAALGVDTGVSKPEVSRICARLDQRVTVFRNRTLGHVLPVAALDAGGAGVLDALRAQGEARRWGYRLTATS